MGLRIVTGEKVPVNYGKHREPTATDPHMIFYRDGKGQASARMGDLIAVTGIGDPALIAKVVSYAAQVPDDKPWTKKHVTGLCKIVGKVPFPKTAMVEMLKGQATMLVKALNGPPPEVTQDDENGNGIVNLVYSGRNNPTFTVGAALKDENIEIPVGMCLVASASLVLDEGALKVEVNLRTGTQRALNKREKKKAG